MKVNVAGRRHRRAFGLEPPPFASDHSDLRKIDRVAKYRTGESDFAGGQGTGAAHHARDLVRWRAAASPATCRARAASLGQNKSRWRNASMSETADRVKK